MRTVLPSVHLPTAMVVGSILLFITHAVRAQHELPAGFSSRGKTVSTTPLPERRISFEMRDKPWLGEKGVLEWLSDQTGLPVSISSAKPTGTLTFINPHAGGPPKQYSLAEVIDILNGE